MEKADLSAEVIDNILRTIYDTTDKLNIPLSGTALEPVPYPSDSLPPEEQQRLAKEHMGICVRTTRRLSRAEKQRIQKRIIKALLHFEVRRIPRLSNR